MTELSTLLECMPPLILKNYSKFQVNTFDSIWEMAFDSYWEMASEPDPKSKQGQ